MFKKIKIIEVKIKDKGRTAEYHENGKFRKFIRLKEPDFLPIKKLKVKRSLELLQDLNAFHNLNSEKELFGTISKNIANKIDEWIIKEITNKWK